MISRDRQIEDESQIYAIHGDKFIDNLPHFIRINEREFRNGLGEPQHFVVLTPIHSIAEK